MVNPRQQSESPSGSAKYCISDLVAPVESGVLDYIGMFAVSAGFGCEEMSKRFIAANDDYNSILVSALADRLSEAFAELLHHRQGLHTYIHTLSSVDNECLHDVCFLCRVGGKRVLLAADDETCLDRCRRCSITDKKA